MKDDRVYLNHILESIQRIARYTEGGHEAFAGSELIQDGVIRNLQTLGQSTLKLSDAFRASHPEIPWRGIIGFRNVLVHDYLGVNVERVWEIVERDLPDLKQKVENLLKNI